MWRRRKNHLRDLPVDAPPPASVNDHDQIIRLERDVYWQARLADQQHLSERELSDEKLRSRDLALQLEAAVHGREASALAVAKDQLAEAKGGSVGRNQLIALIAALVVIVAGVLAFVKP